MQPLCVSGFYSQFTQALGRGGSGILCRFVHHVPNLRGHAIFAKDRADGQPTGAEQALAGPVVVEAAVDGAEVIGKVDISSHSDHSDEAKEQRVYMGN